jgi:pSer/pThr/pTyr-binding forkhead associated (FHA) protein
LKVDIAKLHTHSAIDRLMKIRLELVHKNAKVKKVVLKADTIIGRSAECGLRIASNEVSRQHCKVCVSEEAVTVRDLGSSNGTFVNGYQLEAETDYEIAPDSELSVGGIKFVVRFEEPQAPQRQTDGLGSTVDLKPGTFGYPGETPAGPANTADAAFEETLPLPAEEEPAQAVAAPPDETTETVARDADELDLGEEEPEVELEATGTSAILEREPDPADEEETENVETEEAAPDPIFPGLDLEQDLEPDSSLEDFFQKFE